MKPYQRAALALAVLKIENNSVKSSIYDFGESRYCNISGSVNPQEIKLYDYDRGAYFEGRFNGSEYSLYDYEHSEYISLKRKSNRKYEGYHYGSSSYYEITVSGSSISFYDYGTGEYYSFS